MCVQFVYLELGPFLVCPLRYCTVSKVRGDRFDPIWRRDTVSDPEIVGIGMSCYSFIIIKAIHPSSLSLLSSSK
jgi:hypothetical protein